MALTKAEVNIEGPGYPKRRKAGLGGRGAVPEKIKSRHSSPPAYRPFKPSPWNATLAFRTLGKWQFVKANVSGFPKPKTMVIFGAFFAHGDLRKCI